MAKVRHFKVLTTIKNKKVRKRSLLGTYSANVYNLLFILTEKHIKHRHTGTVHVRRLGIEFVAQWIVRLLRKQEAWVRFPG